MMRKIGLIPGIMLLWTSFTFAELPLLKPLLEAQKNNPEITIPKGKYLMDAANGGGYKFYNLRDVVIDMNGSEIICNAAGNVFTFENCSNVTVRNFSVDFDPLLFTQGVITSINKEEKYIDFTIDEGYPLTDITNSRTQFFDPETRELKRNSLTIYSNGLTVSPIEGSASQFRARKLYSWDALEEVGDLIALSRSGNGHCFYLYRCSDMKVENVTLYGAQSFAFYENEADNSTYLRCKVALKKNEPERPSPRLRSSNADGLHSKNARKGPRVEDCEIQYGGDDCIAINGAMYPIYKVDKSSRSVYFLMRGTTSYISANDSVQLVAYSGKKLAVAKVELTRGVIPSGEEIDSFLAKYPSLQGKEDYTTGLLIRLNAIPEELAAGDVLYNKGRIGSGFVIRNNKVGHIRSRAILIKASDGIITGNTIEDCEMGGIVISPEYDWMEAGFSGNLEISHNTITNCMFGRSAISGKAGALSVMCVGGNGPNASIAPVGAYSSISIHDNQINDCPRPAVVITSVEALSYYNNTCFSDLSTVRRHGEYYGVPNNVDLWTKNVSYKTSGIPVLQTDKENKVVAHGGYLSFPVDVSDVSMTLFDSLGKCVMKRKLSYADHIVDCTGLGKGWYILTLEKEKMQESYKIIF